MKLAQRPSDQRLAKTKWNLFYDQWSIHLSEKLMASWDSKKYIKSKVVHNKIISKKKLPSISSLKHLFTIF